MRIEVYQTKEKYNGLRFHTNGIIKAAEKMVDNYEDLSYNVNSISGKLVR